MGFSDNEVNKTRELLSKHSWFAQATVDDLNQLIAFGSISSVNSQEILLQQDEPITSFYLILKGQAGIYHHDVSTPKQLLMIIEEGAHFGLMGPLFFAYTYTHSLSVITHSPTIIWRISLYQLQEFFADTAATDFKKYLIAETSPYFFIKNWAPFSHLSADHLSSIGKHFDTVFFSESDIVLSKGEPSGYCYFIIFGKIAIADSESARAELGPLDYFGEDSVLSTLPSNYTATAVTPCLLLRLPAHDLLSWVKNDKTMVHAIFKTQIHRGRPYQTPGTVIIEPVNPSNEKWRLLKNNHTQQYFQLSEQGWYVWSKINGAHTFRDLIIIMYHDLQLFEPDYIYQLLISLKLGGYIILPTTVDAFFNAPLPWWKKSLIVLSDIMQVSYVFDNNDRWLTRSYNAFIKYFYSPFSLIMSLVLAVIGFLCFVFFAPASIKMIAQGNLLFYFLYALPFMYGMLLVHELAHAYTTKYFGRAVQYIGIGWFWLGPVAFIDTSEMWAGTNKQRVLVNLAGIFIELVVAGVVALLSLSIENKMISGSMWLFCFSTYIAAFCNLCPIFEYDGYYIIMDILNKPNLRVESVSWLMSIFSNPKLLDFKHYRAEIIYLLYSLCYVLIASVLTYLIQGSILEQFFPNSVFNKYMWLLPVIFFIASITTLLIKQKHLDDLKYYD